VPHVCPPYPLTLDINKVVHHQVLVSGVEYLHLPHKYLRFQPCPSQLAIPWAGCSPSRLPVLPMLWSLPASSFCITSPINCSEVPLAELPPCKAGAVHCAAAQVMGSVPFSLCEGRNTLLIVGMPKAWHMNICWIDLVARKEISHFVPW
jgi:hypothetical protein